MSERARDEDGPRAEVPRLVDHLFRHSSGRLVAGLVRVFGPAHLDLVEDVVQEALMKALRLWPYEGVPRNPDAWLVQVAKNLALDALRRHALADQKQNEIARWAESELDEEVEEGIADDRLKLVFTCCHPSLAFEARVALTLKTLCGLSTSEIARAFLVVEPTIAQRIVRTKRRIQEEAIPFEVPAGDELALRLDAVLEVIYLVFNEGYSAHEGEDLVRADLVDEAIRLAELLLDHQATATPRVHALLALMCFQAARIPSRLSKSGEVLTLANQDRTRWDRERLSRGWMHFEHAIEGDELSAYHLEAAIAAVHAAAPSYADTDWSAIVARYDKLAQLSPSPIVRLNRAVAIAKASGAAAGLVELDLLEQRGELASYYLLPATRGLFLWARGEHAAAANEFKRALRLVGTAPERRLLERRIESCASGQAAEEF